ncbi:MAG: zinc metalloprotease [Symploca sp. SIO2E6]|nr:zinc metalloprotease [Symploca sp. SIO2E6]
MTVELLQRRTCGTMDMHYQLLTTNLTYAINQRKIKDRSLQPTLLNISVARTSIRIIPVVVHVVYNPNRPKQKISEAQVCSQIDVLNKDFRAKNSDIVSVPSVFKHLIADARIEFVLATTDPQGNPSKGIIYTSTTARGFATDNSVKSAATGGADPWPSDRYLNIWVCRLYGGILGYAQFPGGPSATDGVVITHTAFGTIGTATAPYNLGRTTTHEIGHWLNLRHIWGEGRNSCGDSDLVDDTPNQAGPSRGKPSFPNVTCDNSPHGDLFMNYMDYSEDAAMSMFTVGQVARMQAVLDNERASIGI